MSEIQNRYNLTDAQYKGLIKDGWISCSAPQYEEIYIHYKSSKSLQKTADHFNVSKKWVYDIVHKFE